MRTLLLFVFSLFYAITSLAQGSFIIKSQSELYEVMSADSIFKSNITLIEKLGEGIQSKQSQYEIQFFKKVKGKRGFEELRMIQLLKEKKVKLIIIKKFIGGQPKMYTFDATQFYDALKTKIDVLNSKHFVQSFPENFVGANERNSIVWRVIKEENIIASIFSLDIPSIAFKDNDESFPPSEWNQLVNLDINKLNNISVKEKKNRKRKNK